MSTMLAGPLSRQVTLAQVTMLVAAADAQSFSAAAKILGVSQSTLSRNIADMENALGYPLFDRTSQGVSLSSHGQTFRDRGRSLLAAHADAQHALGSWRAVQRGRMRLVGSSSVMPVMLPTLLRNLRREFGCASMQVEDSMSIGARRSVLEGKAALGVFADIEPHAELRCSLAMEAQLGLLASPRVDLPDRIDSLDALAELSVPILKFDADSPISLLLRHHGIRFAGYFNSPVAVSCVVASIDLVQQGEAVALSSGIGASHARAAGLRFIPLPGLLPSANIYVASRRGSVFDPAQEKLRDLLMESIKQTTWHASVRVTHAARPQALQLTDTPLVSQHITLSRVQAPAQHAASA